MAHYRRALHIWPLFLVLALLALVGACGDQATGSGIDVGDDDLLEDIADEDSVEAPSCDDGCNDDNACTADRCDDDGVTCVHTFDEALCCTSDQCEIEGACVENGDANPDNPCQMCARIANAQAWSADDTAACDDGNACTLNDACTDGECRGAPVFCDDDNPCTDDACDGDSGACVSTHNEAPCDDGDACTTHEQCAAGVCVPGTPITCDDGDVCTDDACDPAVGCIVTPNDGAACDDGDSCSLVDVCQGGVCIPEEVDSCDDTNLCTADFCDSEEGCGHHDLDDLCIDTNPCTDEVCDPAQGCIYPFNTNPCDDTNACTLGDICTTGSCLGVLINPDDSNPCTDDACDTQTGVSNTANTLPCDDNNACTVGDICANATCLPGATPLNCDDSDVCTDDSCDAIDGCANLDVSAQCDDGNVCTIDSCDAVDGCRNAIIASFFCRPTIVVDYPPRAATIQAANPAVVVVTGSVVSGAGTITSFTLNGQSVTVAADGSFSVDFSAQVGPNVLSFLAHDELGTEQERVQAFHWSHAYTNPDPLHLGSGAVDPGLGIWLGQQTLDDKQAPPPTDFAAIIEGVVAGLDGADFFDPNTPIVEDSGGFDVYLETLNIGSTAVAIDAINGGLHLQIGLLNTTGDLWFECVASAFTCFFTGGSGGGDITIDSIALEADLYISVAADHTLVVTVANENTTITGLEISADNGWTNFLISIIEAAILDGVVSDLEAELTTMLTTMIGPMLGDALSALAFNIPFELPRLDGAIDPATGDPITIPVLLASDFTYAAFQDHTVGPPGGALGLRAWATTPTRGVPAGAHFDDNLGVPMRVACGSGTQNMVVPRLAPMEIIFPDDTINHILRASWWGGLLEFPVDAALMGDVDLSAYGITNLTMWVSSWLPPVASDCGPNGDLRLGVGDLEIIANMELFGAPMDVVVYVSFDAPIELTATNGEVAITIYDIENVELEVNVVQEALVGSEAVVADLLRSELVPSLGAMFGGGQALASFPLPEMDLSESLGQAAGTTVIRIQTLNDPSLQARQGGNTIVYGRLE